VLAGRLNASIGLEVTVPLSTRVTAEIRVRSRGVGGN
jgi:hypothetical protein